ncbi:hypothetical protein BS47DRAFT_1290088 [Hydnum rufescens UP504]|uniref:SET domain-containing protein n=1 Tax=Hydnum rufescens UP504 TaxID=1448309 RepID=A0A9P6B8A7_9AGAM|nr:hypothetical protein BS47DRAFT_1290088 [Hydnum rufescens UP504]
MRLRARLPVHNPQDVLRIIRKVMITSLSSEVRCRKATNDLLALAFVAKHIKTKTAEQIDAFATHAWRYFKLYLPNGTVEIAHTARYTWRTGKTELCVLATAPIRGGEYIEELEGSMARLSPEEDADLSRSRDDGLGSRRDFSVVQVMGGNRSLLFLGPARFVNHDCNANCELERKDKVMRFKTKRAIGAGEEITAHYATDYFGKDNCECLCQTCEDAGAGGFAPKPKPENEEDISSQEEEGEISSRRTGGGPYKSDAIENSQEEVASKEGINSSRRRRHRARVRFIALCGSQSQINGPHYSVNYSGCRALDWVPR